MKVHQPLLRLEHGLPASSDLSTGTKRAFDRMMGGRGDEVISETMGNTDDGDWFDEMAGPLDTELQLSGEGGEAEHLSEYLGQ
jgi:hypothetical protein